MKVKIGRWYAMGLWNESMVNIAVEKGILSEEEASQILK